jgi:hypothetical protein
MTSSDGEFTIPSRFFFTFALGYEIDGPQLAFFKESYGGWRHAASPDALTGEGAVIELKPLTTQEEQLKYLERKWSRKEREELDRSWTHTEYPANPEQIPYREARTYESAINAARANFGLRPIGIGYPGLATNYYEPPPAEAPEEALLRRASGIAIDTQGHIYVADTGNHRIVKYGTDLSVIKKWGTFGREEGQLQFPRSVAVDHVADWNNRRVQAFTSDGRYLNRFGKLNYDDLQGGFTPEKIGITKAGEIIVQESDDVYVFTRSGRLLNHWRKLNLFRAHTRVAIEPDGHIVGITGKLFSDPVMLRLDTAGNQVAGWGVYGKGRGQLYHPSAVTIDPAGRPYLRSRLERFQLSARGIRSWRHTH